MSEAVGRGTGLAGRGQALVTRSLGSKRVRRALVIVTLFIVWELAARQADSALLPSVTGVVSRLLEDLRSGLIWRHGKTTLFRGFSGFGIATAAGITAGLAMARNRVLRAMFEPLLAALYPVPKLALYPIVILTLGFGSASKVALVAVECFYPIAYNTFWAAGNVPRKMIWLSQSLGASRSRTISQVVLKSSLPAILAGIRIALPVMLIIIVVTEMIGESLGLGYLIRRAGTNFEPEGALAIVLLLGIFGYFIDRFMLYLIGVLAFWESGVEL